MFNQFQIDAMTRHGATPAQIEARAAHLARQARMSPARPVELPQPEPQPFNLRVILPAVARARGVDMSDVMSDSRRVEVVLVRHIAMWIFKELRPMTSFPVLSRGVGLKDHTTALTAMRRFPERMARNPGLKDDVDRLLDYCRQIDPRHA